LGVYTGAAIPITFSKEMKIHPFVAIFLGAGLALGQEFKIDLSHLSEYTPIPNKQSDDEARPETALDGEIEKFRQHHGAYNAVLVNNSGDRVLNAKGEVVGQEAMGSVVNPTAVLIIARSMVADPVVDLYTSIKELPDCAHTVRILYTESQDRSESSLLGYTIENPKGVYTKLVQYDGKTPWLEWITESFKIQDKENKAEMATPRKPSD
jgi:hypothetical protein